ncbi:hypothetical protein MGH68_14865 [Erysipelothrix sp. D19-032]
MYNSARYHRFKDGRTDVLESNLLRIFDKDLDANDFDKKIKHLYEKNARSIITILIKDKTIHNRSTPNIYDYEPPYNLKACYILNSQYGEALYSTL